MVDELEWPSQENGRCVGRPDGYSATEACAIIVEDHLTLAGCPIFNTEAGYDALTIDGDEYDGADCPSGKCELAATL